MKHNVEQQQRLNIEFNVFRLHPPITFNTHNPLSGSYNDIHNNEDINTYPLQNKIKNFNVSNFHFPGYTHMFAINHKFGKVIVGENFNALIIIYNHSSTQYIKICNPKIVKKIIDNESKINYTYLSKNEKNTIMKEHIMFPYDIEILKVNEFINKHSKFSFTISLSALPYEPPKEGMKEKKANTKLSTPSKTFSFEVLEPFVIKEKFFNDQMSKYYIELRIENTSKTKLMIKNIEILPETTTTTTNNNVTTPLSLYPTNTSCNNVLLQTDETFSFVVSTVDALASTSLIVNVNWSNMLTPCYKVFSKKIKNEFYNVDNNYFKLNVKEYPNVVTVGTTFKVVFEVVNKTTNILSLCIDVERKNEGNVIDDRLIEVIDVVDKQIEVNKNEHNVKEFNVVCRANIIGNMFLPSFTIRLDNKNSFGYNKLLCFNCIQK